MSKAKNLFRACPRPERKDRRIRSKQRFRKIVKACALLQTSGPWGTARLQVTSSCDTFQRKLHNLNGCLTLTIPVMSLGCRVQWRQVIMHLCLHLVRYMPSIMPVPQVTRPLFILSKSTSRLVISAPVICTLAPARPFQDL